MATTAIYRVLPLTDRVDVETTEPFPTAARTVWELTLHIARLESGGSVQIKLQSSPDGLSEWTDRHDFGTIDEAALVTEISPRVAAVTVPISDKYLRGDVAASTGTFYLELLAASAFLNPYNTTHTFQLTKRLREFADGLVRLTEGAEDDVLQYLGKDVNGILQSSAGMLTRPDALDHIQAGIALQADWLFQKDQLARSTDADDAEALDRMGRYHPDVGSRLAAVMTAEEGRLVWLGR